MKANIFLSAVVAVCFGAAPAMAGEFSDMAMRMALATPEVTQAQAAVKAVEADGKADNALGGIEVGGEYKFGPAGERRWGVSAGQEFDWPGVYGARRRANAFRADAFRQLRDDCVRSQWLAAATAMADFAAADLQRRLLQRALDNIVGLDSLYRRQLEKGEITILDMKKVSLEKASLATRTAEATARCAAARAVIESYASAASLVLPDSIALPAVTLLAQETYMQACAASSGRKALTSLSAAAVADIDVARRKALPSFRLAYVHDFEDGRHFNGMALSVTLPQWTPRHAVDAARARASQTEAQLAQYDIARSAQLAADYRQAAALARRISDMSELDGMDDYPALLAKALQRGVITLPQYVTDYNFYLETMSGYYALLHEQTLAQLRLEQYLADSGTDY